MLASAAPVGASRRVHKSRAPAARAAPLVVTQAPEQIRLTFTNSDSEMGVYFVTSNKTSDDYVATVMYGPSESKMDLVATGSNSNYTVFNIKSPSLHFVVLPELTPGAFVWYKVGSPVYGWSINYNFTVKPAAGPQYPLTWLAYGDMGISNSENTAALTAKLIRSGEAQFITHAGDISYADNRASINNGSIYEGVLNDFYNEVQPSSAYAAYMTSSGNHEAIVDFLAYRMRNSPTMPQNGGLFWHSYNVGPVHFLAFDIDQTWAAGSPQHAFITADLAAVDRAVTPWVVAYNHFPLICSNLFWCPGALSFQALYEPIFNAPATKVDLFYAGHVHAAEVMYPQLGGKVVQTNFDNVAVTNQVMVGFPGQSSKPINIPAAPF